MNELQIFNYGEIPVRTILQDDEPWWILKDVCQVLGIAKHRDTASRLDDDERGSVKVDTPGGKQNMTIINESGLYKVILRSDKPEAMKFTRWVTHEVLPAIRKTGTYSVAPGGSPVPELRALTTDDFIGASRIIADCRNERLPYVIGLLEQGGFKFPKAESIPVPKQAVRVERTLSREIINLEDFL